MKLRIVFDFAFAHHGYDVKQYTAGDVIDAEDPELVEIAVREGWASDADAPEPQTKAKKGAPENKARGE